MRVQQVHQAAAGPRPQLDLEHQQVIVAARPELDLAGLHVTAQSRKVQGLGITVYDPDGSVPGARHLHQQLVRDVQTLRAEFTHPDGDHLRGDETLEVLADQLDEPASVDLGLGDAYTKKAVEQGSAAVLDPLHPTVDRFRGQRGRAVLLVTPTFAAPVQGSRFPEITPGDQRRSQEPARQHGKYPRTVRSRHPHPSHIIPKCSK